MGDRLGIRVDRDRVGTDRDAFDELPKIDARDGRILREKRASKGRDEAVDRVLSVQERGHRVKLAHTLQNGAYFGELGSKLADTVEAVGFIRTT